VGKTKGRTLARRWPKWENNVKWIEEIELEDVERINLAWNEAKWWAFV
jgi:hypothetical protein